MKKINKEFEDIMFTKTEGRMIEQLTVPYYCYTIVPGSFKDKAFIRPSIQLSTAAVQFIKSPCRCATTFWVHLCL